MVIQTKFNIPIAKPTFTGDEADAIRDVLLSGWVTQGPTIGKFESAFAEYVNVPYAVSTSNCTTGLHLSMMVYGIGPGDDVLCPSYSFIASANGVRHAGAEPRFIDIDPNTLNIDPVLTQKYIDENYDANLIHKKHKTKLKAILIVHQIGIPADIDAFNSIAAEYGIPVIEDAACAIGSDYKGARVGSSGNLCAFSFHPRKVITTGEGGMLTTKSAELAENARVRREHGASISAYVRHNSSSTTYESYDVVGYNYRITDMQASLGLSQLAQLEQFIQRRLEIASRYNQAFSNLPNVTIVGEIPYVTRWNYQSYPLRFEGKDAAYRDRFMLCLQEAGIATRRGIPPIHKFAVYEEGQTLTNTEKVSETSLFLPIFPKLSDEEVDHIIEHVTKTASL